jgi:hypothetical protein
MLPMMQRVLEAAKMRTRFSLTRGFRRWRWRHRFLPTLAWRGGWRALVDGELRGKF